MLHGDGWHTLLLVIPKERERERERERSLAQNIDDLFFSPDGELSDEFDELYSSLFKNPDHYIPIVTTLGKKRIGMTRSELIKEGHITNNGNLTKALKDLEYCGFIRKYAPLGKKSRGQFIS